MKVIGIQRDERFSPNSVDKDLDILNRVVSIFQGNIIREEELNSSQKQLSQANIILSMSRSNEALDILQETERKGLLVINPAEGIRLCCHRSELIRVMKANRLPVPPEMGVNGYWIKRGDASAQSHGDVVYCKDKASLIATKESFAVRGITDLVIQAHVQGDLVKFYGVEGTGFFRAYYPGDDGDSKFGDELINGQPHHFFYQKELLQASAEQLSRLINLPVYGGDAIINRDGDFVIIDFNDWPSFSRCKTDAADAICQLIRYKI